MKALILFSVFAFIIGISFGLYFLGGSGEPDSPFANMNIGGDFMLHHGDDEVRLSDYHGRVVLIFFGYTSCPDICPATMASIAAALKKLSGDELSKLQVLFISVDPERDTADDLDKFTEYFHPSILGITGSKQEIDRVVKQYGSTYRRVKSDSALGYLVDHSSAIYLVSTEGKLINMLPGSEPVEELVSTVRDLIE
jgi:protein SCO1/2